MNVVFGLGNPGSQYEQTRHNAGFMMVDEWVKSAANTFQVSRSEKFKAELMKSSEALLVKPLTFMNESGFTAKQVLSFQTEFKRQPEETLKHVFVAHDDLDIEVGKYKLHFGRGPKVHNGLRSIYDHLHSDQFWHVRIGVDGRRGDRTLPGHEYVLQGFKPDEKLLLVQCIDRVIAELKTKMSAS